MNRHFERISLGCLLALPLLLLHAHGFAEVPIALIDLLFLTRCALLRDWRWLRAPWVLLAGAWWGWLVFCSLPVPALGLGPGGGRSFTQALLTARFLLLAAALEHAVLREAPPRRWLAWINAAAAIYIAAQSVVQFTFGTNLYGDPRGADGELTGPFDKPRAAPPLSRIILPAVLPAVARSLAAPGLRARLAAGGLMLGSLALMVLIGQRMPLLLTAFGLAVSALFLKRLRGLVLITLAAGVLLIAASAIVSPPAYYRLVQKFGTQMEHFPDSPYGLIYGRAVAIAEQQPIIGRGFDGYRTGCPMPRYWQGWLENPATRGGGGGPQICVQHPHNFYLQALTDGGIPGVVLFACLALAWMAALGRGLWRDPEPRRVGLFVSALISLWPLASTSAFTSMPMGGWFFLLLGWGLAEARHGRAAA